jgi:Domain of unknown function (DUF3883)
VLVLISQAEEGTMPIPQGITRQDVLDALADLDRGVAHSFRAPTRYELVYQRRRYPPKAAIGLAARRILGVPNPPNDFSGGNGPGAANTRLQALGFTIEAFRPLTSPMGVRATHRAHWVAREVEVAVGAYFGMLDHQLAGQPFIKRAVVQATLPLLPGRTRGSLEFMFANISAALDDLELPWIHGYKPRPHYQRGIRIVVFRHLADHVALAERLAEVDEEVPAAPPPMSPTGPFVAPPSGAAAATGNRHGIARGHWSGARDQANRALGLAGEKWVVDIERTRLLAANRADLAERVEHVVVTIGDGLGYDVRSYSDVGAELWIEVKTTNSGPGTPFIVTANELAVSRAEPAKFHLYRVFLFSSIPKIYTLEGDLGDHVDLEPLQYLARLKPARKP